ncbi:MAG: choice-of-anchor Q domain-containing protein [Solirubrobacterales bacterium]
MSARSVRRGRECAARREARRGTRPCGRSKAAAGAGAALGVTVLFAPAAKAATFTVTNLNDDGPGSLRQAVVDSNAIGDDVIVFESGLSGTITLTSGDLDIFEGEGDLDIQGPGASEIAVRTNGSSRIFEVYNSEFYSISISDLTLRDGLVVGDGGAIFNHPGSGAESADLSLTGVILTGNEATLSGGAVYNRDGALTIADSILSGNQAGGGGGALYSGGSVTITDSTIADNTADNGGAIYVEDVAQDGGGVVVERSSVTGNSAQGRGGGLSTFSNEGGVVIDSSTFSGNRTDDYAGGIFLAGDDGPITIRNTTVSGNSAGEEVGGIASRGLDDVPVTIQSSTIVDNSQSSALAYADYGAGVHLHGEDDLDPGVDTLTLSSTIVAGNTGGAGDLGELFDQGSFVLGFSLVGNTGNATVTEDPAGSNHFGQDPQLGPLQDNGGPTQTHLPAQTSPAIDKGIANGLATDQRGLARTGDVSAIANAPGDDGTDIGSVELQAADCQGVGVFSITGTAGNDTLTGDASPNAIFGGAGDDTINGLEGNDCLNGEDGNDVVNGGSGKDVITGGAGKDRLKGQGGRDTLRGGPGKDNLKGGGGKDKLRGGPGKDKLNGGAGKDNLKGGAGKDKIRGGPGKDRLKGQGGNDKINAVDGKRDKVNCGGGNKDKAVVDPEDKVSQNCEKVVEKGG